MPTFIIPEPASFDPLSPERAARWAKFGAWETVYFPTFVGLALEEARTDYARMRVTYADHLQQPAGVVHGGVIATLIDTVVVPAIGSGYDEVPIMLTLSMNIQYVGAVREQDLVAHGWVTRRGKSIVFCEAAVTSADGTPAATGSLVYSVRPMPNGHST